MAFGGNHSSAGLTLHFDAYGGNYAEEVAIKWLDGNNTLLHSQSFQPDGPRYFCEAKVEHYQKLVLTFGKSHKPQHYFKLQAIDYGIQKYFGPQEVASLSMLEEIDATLVHSGIGAAAAQRLYEARQQRCQGEAAFQVAKEKPGDRVTLACRYQQALCGTVTRLETDVTGGMLGKAVIGGGLANAHKG